MKIRRSCLAPLLVSLLIGEPAHAAPMDRANHGDVSDERRAILTPGPEDPRLPSIVAGDLESRAPSFSVVPSLSWVYATNGGQVATDIVATTNISPGLSLDYKVPHLGKWAFEGNLFVDADYMGRGAQFLNESRMDLQLGLARETPIGDLSLGFQTKSSFAETFGAHETTDERFSIAVAPSFGKAIGLTLGAEHRASDTASARRELLMASAGKSWPFSRTGEFQLAETLRYSHFVAGANRGREDLLTETSASFVWSSGRYEWALNGTLFSSLSNRSDKRFIDLELGPAIKAKF